MLKVKSLLANKIKLYSQSLVDNEQQQEKLTQPSNFLKERLAQLD